MKRFATLLKKKGRNVIGILSGTSIDAVDVVLVRISGSGTHSKLEVKDFRSYRIHDELKEYILTCSDKERGNVEDICRLNFIIGRLFADSINKFIRANKLRNTDIDLIGSHGQTIYHYPHNNKRFGFNSKSTLQVGDPSVISCITGILTVGDFRTADIAAGGEGAPLVPYLDYVMYGNSDLNRAVINIGGIANVTYLKKNSKRDDIIAFDAGPGNIIVDWIAKKYFGKKFDRGGGIAFKGNVNEKLLEYICDSDTFYKRKYPKSTGREHYGRKFVDNILKNFKLMKPEDIMSTFAKFTSFALHYNLRRFPVDEIILSGGGAKNHFMVKLIREYFRNSNVRIANENGITADNKEAVLFALLANELINGNETNLPTVTGARRNVFLGKICPA